MKKVKYLIFLMLAVGFFSCETMDDPEMEYASTYPVSGEWYVRFEVQDPTDNSWADVPGYGSYNKILTYNTASNSSDTIWIDDLNHIWSFKIKCPIQLSARTFSTPDSVLNSDPDYPINVLIKNGSVHVGKGKSISGVTTDSIYFEIGFTDDPGTQYRLSGFRRTGFLEDEPE